MNKLNYDCWTNIIKYANVNTQKSLLNTTKDFRQLVSNECQMCHVCQKRVGELNYTYLYKPVKWCKKCHLDHGYKMNIECQETVSGIKYHNLSLRTPYGSAIHFSLPIARIATGSSKPDNLLGYDKIEFFTDDDEMVLLLTENKVEFRFIFYSIYGVNDYDCSKDCIKNELKEWLKMF